MSNAPSIASALRWPARRRGELVHAARMTASSIAAYALVYAIGLSEGLWAVITAIVVSQSSIGGSLKAAFDQLAGSLFGAAYAAAIALALAPDDPVTSAIALAVGLAPPSILAALSPGFRIAPITAAIMLLGGAGLGLGPLGMAFNRMVEVGLGCVVGVLVSILIVPASASRALVEIVGRTAELMAAQLQALASGRDVQAQLGILAGRVRENLIRLALLAEDAGRERRTLLDESPDARPLLRTMTRLRLDIDMLRRAAREAGGEGLHDDLAGAWSRAAASGAAALRRAGAIFAGGGAPDAGDDLADAVRAYRSALDDMRRAGLTRPLSTETLGRLFGIGFALDQLRRDLDELVALSGERAGARRSALGPPNA
jgi:uncharacterized membrane protein YccC